MCLTRRLVLCFNHPKRMLKLHSAMFLPARSKHQQIGNIRPTQRPEQQQRSLLVECRRSVSLLEAPDAPSTRTVASLNIRKYLIIADVYLKTSPAMFIIYTPGTCQHEVCSFLRRLFVVGRYGLITCLSEIEIEVEQTKSFVWTARFYANGFKWILKKSKFNRLLELVHHKFSFHWHAVSVAP